jgi:hypothetical protein
MRGANYGANTNVLVTATCDSLVDTGSVVRVRDGTLATTVRLSNPNHPVPAPFGSTSMAGALAGSGTTLFVYEGSTLRDITAVTIAGVNVTTPGTLAAIVGGAAYINPHTGITAVSGQVNYTITFTRGDGTSGQVYGTQYLQLQIEGEVGAPGGDGDTGARSAVIGLYAWAFSDPGAPSGSSTYTWANAVPHVYSGSTIWSVALPEDTVPWKKLYYTEQVISDPTGVAATTGATWVSTTRSVLSTNPPAIGQCFARYTGNGAVPSGKVVTPLGKMPISTDFSTTWLADFVAAQPALSTGQTLWLCDGYPNNLTNPVAAGAFVIGNTYTIISVGTTNFTAIGAASNTVGLTFVATGVGSGTGTAFLAAVSVTAGSFVAGVSYTITSVGTTSFTGIGAASNTVGLTFQATGPGTGTGKATTAVICWAAPYIANFKVGSLSALQANLGTVNIDTDGAVRTNGINFGGTGVYLGYSAAGTYYGTVYGAAAYRMSIGDGTNYLAWDGAALKLNGTAVSTVVAGAAAGTSALAGLPAKLEASSSYVLTGVVTPTNTGGIATGNLTWNATTGVLTGTGTGVAITENGIIGALGGAVKFSLLTDGTATFAGTLSAAVGNFGAVTADSSLTLGTNGYISNGINFGGVGLFMGYSPAGTYYGTVYGAAAYRFSIGNSTTYLAWDGTAMSIVGGGINVGDTGFVRGGKAADGTGYGFFLGKLGSYHKLLLASPIFDIASISYVTDVFTTVSNHNLPNGTPISFSSVTHLSGVVVDTDYFMRDVTANTFKLAATLGGAAINLTDPGGGTPFANINYGKFSWDGQRLTTENARFLGGSISTNSGSGAQIALSEEYGPILWMTDNATADYFSLCLSNTEAVVEVQTTTALGLGGVKVHNINTGRGVKLSTATEDIELLTGQVKFPATNVPSTDANTLDDYQEGTWTPTLTMASGSCTLTTAVGSYTKIGNRVQLEATVVVNTVSTPSGALTLGGLPFTSLSTPTGMKIPASLWAEGLGATNSAGTLMAHLATSATSINISRLASGVRTNDVGAAVQAASVISVSISYTTAS